MWGVFAVGLGGRGGSRLVTFSSSMISRHPHFEFLQPARNAGSRVRLPAVVCYLDPLAHLERGRADVRARRWWLWALSAAPPLRGTRNTEHVGAPLPPSLGALDACSGAARARACGGAAGARALSRVSLSISPNSTAMSSIFCFCSAISASLRASSCARRSVRPTEPGARLWRAV